jgi:corrinoid protein of di/trimethylamine methyltransferase
MQKEMILRELEQAVENCDVEAAKEAAKKALEAGIDPMVAIEEGAAKGVRKVGEKFHKGEVFLPHLVLAGDAMTEVVKILEKAIPKEKAMMSKRGRVVIGTVKGDIHDIGKNIVAAYLTAAGFEVHDLGKDVHEDRFIDKALEVNADVIAASALMTITMPAQRELIEELKRRGLREKFKVVVGGGCVYPEWAKEIGADGYGKDATEAVEVIKKLIESSRQQV